jgi:hypothetical protein
MRTGFFDMFLNDFRIRSDYEGLLPQGFHFLNARSRASYSVVLFMKCSFFVNMSRAAYLITTLAGDVTIAEIPTPL